MALLKCELGLKVQEELVLLLNDGMFLLKLWSDVFHVKKQQLRVMHHAYLGRQSEETLARPWAKHKCVQEFKRFVHARNGWPSRKYTQHQFSRWKL